MEQCPICFENDAEYLTECKHAYCINCLCKIKTCALCRKSLKKGELCIQIKSYRYKKFRMGIKLEHQVPSGTINFSRVENIYTPLVYLYNQS